MHYKCYSKFTSCKRCCARLGIGKKESSRWAAGPQSAPPLPSHAFVQANARSRGVDSVNLWFYWTGRLATGACISASKKSNTVSDMDWKTTIPLPQNMKHASEYLNNYMYWKIEQLWDWTIPIRKLKLQTEILRYSIRSRVVLIIK